jgi:hypothetical protein
VLRSQHRVYDGRGEVARTQDVWGAEGISGRVKFLLLAWAGIFDVAVIKHKIKYSHHEFYGFYPCYYRLVYLSITQQGVAIQCLKAAHYSSFATS